MTVAAVSGGVAAAVYIAVVVLLAAYGLHTLWLLWRFCRHRQTTIPAPLLTHEPAVLVQIPVYNERDVVARVVAACGALDWPRDRLRVQLLDDSTDDSLAIGATAIAALQAQGIDAVQVQRQDRHGYKAGALEYGLRLDAEHGAGPAAFVAIFDADFVPAADFLRRALPSLLSDPRAAFVQGRWEHLNPHASLLTRAQAVGIDGHFAIEQGARAWSGLALNFNGTCGVWRRSAIADAGGWQHDTLTEDLDLSYRAHLRGWHGVYRLDLAVPGELPPTLEAWRAQQFRWAKGSLQTAIKWLPSIWRSAWTPLRKLAATAHLTHYLVHPLILLSLLLAPLAVPTLGRLSPSWLVLGGGLLVVGMVPPILLYIASQRILGRRWRTLFALPALTALGTGIAAANARAAWQAVRGVVSPFVRTPKQGTAATGSYRAAAASGLPELACAAWGGLGLIIAWQGQSPWLVPILAIYVTGFAHQGLSLFIHRIREALAADTRPQYTSRHLLPIGLIAVLALLFIAVRDTSWREEPLLFALAALTVGGAYLGGLALVRRRALSGRAVLTVLAVGFALQVTALGLWHSDDVNRYIVEGRQLLAGQNPYVIAPATAAAATVVDPAILARVNHPELTAIYPPVALWAHAGIAGLSPTPLAFTIAALVAATAMILLSLALLLRYALPPGLVLATAWNPVLAIFATGEAHNDVLMAVFILIALLLLTWHHARTAVVALTAAILVKPFALAIVPAVLGAGRWRGWWLGPVIVLMAYLPFAAAGSGLVASLLTFGGDMQYHGALEPLLRLTMAPWLQGEALQAAVRVGLLVALAMGTAWLWRRRGGAPLPTLAVRLLGLLLLCLPTIHPWYFLAVVGLLPFARTWALPVWTAMAGVYWLHGLGMLAVGTWTELPWVTALAHAPAIALMAWEAFGPEREQREPGALPFPWRVAHV